MNDRDNAIPLIVRGFDADGNLRATLGPVPPNGKPGPIKPGPIKPGPIKPGPIIVGKGEGAYGTFKPVFPDIVIEEPVWVWDRQPANAPIARSAELFTPVAVSEPPETRWFFGESRDGTICLFVDGDWQAGSTLEIHARAHDHTLGIGHDLFAPSIRLDGGGSTLECARRICDIVSGAFRQQAGVDVRCDVLPQDDGRMKLVLSLVEGNIEWGSFAVCVTPPPDDGGDVLRIDRVSPLVFDAEDTLTIEGVFPDRATRDDFCAAVPNATSVLPFSITRFEDVNGDGAIDLQAIPPWCIDIDFKPGPLVLTAGRGIREGGVWAWRSLPGNPQAVSPEEASPDSG